jgi:hypothetical protein
MAKQMDEPFDEIDKDYDQTGNSIPLPNSLFGEV